MRDLLAADIRRGPNNHLLITEHGLAMLRSLQALCETGHTLKEASNILRYEIDRKDESLARPGSETEQKPDKREETGWEALVEHLAAQVRALERRVAALEARRAGEGGPWWLRWTGAQ